MRVLTIDIGNTAVKGSVFERGELKGYLLAEDRSAESLIPLIRRYDPEGAICCSVGSDAGRFVDRLRELCRFDVMNLSHSTPLPIRVEYATPATLGLDRVAAAVGASLISERALVVDAGTAITLDLVTDGIFRGGNISAGLRLRFRSLNCFTSRLPLVNPVGNLPEFGYDTETALRAGVVQGILDEIECTLRRAGTCCPGMRLLLTGGDADFLAPLLRERGLEPEIVGSLVGRGLEEIYDYNIVRNSSEDADDNNNI